MTSKYSDIKRFFKSFNLSNQNDYEELIKLKNSSQSITFQNPIKPKQVIKQPSLPTSEIINRNDTIIQDDRRSENPPQRNDLSNVIRDQQDDQRNQNILPNQQQINEISIPQQSLLPQQGQIPQQIQPQALSDDKSITSPNNIIISSNTNVDNNNQNNNKPNDNQDNLNNQQQQPNRFQQKQFQKNQYPRQDQEVVEEIQLVNSQGHQFIRIMQFNDNIVFVDESSIYFYLKQLDLAKQTGNIFESIFASKSKENEFSKERLKLIYKLPNKYKFIDASAHEEILCLQIQDKLKISENETDSSYGFLFINFIYDDDNNLQDLKAQIISSISTKIIKCFQLSMQQQIFMYSLESGSLYCFGFDLELKLCYNQPSQLQIVQFVYDEQEEIIIYGTNKGSIHRLFLKNFKVEQEEEILRTERIQLLQFTFGKSQLLMLHSENNKSKASVYQYPSMKLVQTFDTIPSTQYISLYDFVVSIDQTNTCDYFFGLLCDKQLAIYSFQIEPTTSNKSQSNLVYQKELEFPPKCMYFSLENFVGRIIKIYYSNPSQVKDDSYAQCYFRFILDRIDKNAYN